MRPLAAATSSLLRLLFLAAGLVLVAGISGGCATYEYDVIRPPEVGHIGQKEWKSVTLDDAAVEYRLRSANNHLVMDVFNRADDETLKLIGDDSAAVDPKGESHPFKSRTIPPGSYIRLILPPPPPTIRRSGPTFGFGVGVGTLGSRYRRSEFGYGRVYDDDFYDPGPTYYAVYDYSDSTLWQWEGDRTDVKLILIFERGKERLHHELLLRRIKM